MAIDVAWERLLHDWSKSGMPDLSFEFRPSHDADGLDEFVTAALLAADELVDADSPATGDDYPPICDGAVRLAVDSPRYFLTLQDVMDESKFRAWMTRFVEFLEEAGVSGRVVATNVDRHVAWDLVERQPRVSHLATMFAFTTIDPTRRPQVWNVDPAVTRRLGALAAASAFDGAQTLLMSGGTYQPLRETDVEAALVSQVSRRAHTALSHIATDPVRVWHLGFGVNGLASLTVEDPTRSWRDLFDMHLGVMGEFASVVQQAFVQTVTNYPSQWNGLYGGEPPEGDITCGELRYYVHQFDRFTVGPRGALILQSAHLERASDLSAWTLTEVAEDRFLVVAREPDAWFAQPTVDRAFLEEAQRSFGALSLTRDDLVRAIPT